MENKRTEKLNCQGEAAVSWWSRRYRLHALREELPFASQNVYFLFTELASMLIWERMWSDVYDLDCQRFDLHELLRALVSLRLFQDSIRLGSWSRIETSLIFYWWAIGAFVYRCECLSKNLYCFSNHSYVLMETRSFGKHCVVWRFGVRPECIRKNFSPQKGH